MAEYKSEIDMKLEAFIPNRRRRTWRSAWRRGRPRGQSHPPGVLDWVPTHDLTATVIRRWMESACINASIEPEGDVLVSLEQEQVHVTILEQDGLIHLRRVIPCDPDLHAPNDAWLAAVNTANRHSMFLRVSLFFEDEDEEAPFVVYEHLHFAADGIVSRRQLVKLVRAVAQSVAEHHGGLEEAVAGMDR